MLAEKVDYSLLKLVNADIDADVEKLIVNKDFIIDGLKTKIKANNGKRITVTGTKFIDLPTDSSPYQEINGTFTYAKRSKQLLKLEVKNTNFSD